MGVTRSYVLIQIIFFLQRFLSALDVTWGSRANHAYPSFLLFEKQQAGGRLQQQNLTPVLKQTPRPRKNQSSQLHDCTVTAAISQVFIIDRDRNWAWHHGLLRKPLFDRSPSVKVKLSILPEKVSLAVLIMVGGLTPWYTLEFCISFIKLGSGFRINRVKETQWIIIKNPQLCSHLTGFIVILKINGR